MKRKEKRKYKKYLKFLKNDIATAFNIPKKVLFGKKVPVSGVSIVLERAKKIEWERIERAQRSFIEMIREKVKKEELEAIKHFSRVKPNLSKYFDNLEIEWKE